MPSSPSSSSFSSNSANQSPGGTDYHDLRDRVTQQEIQQARIDSVIKLLTEQLAQFTSAMNDFQQTAQEMRIAITKLESNTLYTTRAMGVVGAVVMLIIGAIIGQYVHIHP